MKSKHKLTLLLVVGLLLVLTLIGTNLIRNRYSVSVLEETPQVNPLLVNVSNVPENSLESDIIKYFYNNFGKSSDHLTIEASQNNGLFSRFTVTVLGIDQPYMVLAKSSSLNDPNSKREILYVGIELPFCSLTTEVNIPEGMVPQCIEDSTNQVVSRIQL